MQVRKPSDEPLAEATGDSDVRPFDETADHLRERGDATGNRFNSRLFPTF